MTQPNLPFRPLPWHTVGEPNSALPVDDTPDSGLPCNLPGPGRFRCTMPKFHEDFHRAGDGEVIVAEWAQEQPDEQPQDWYFTWGAGQVLPDGSDADGHYTVIAGTFAEARAEMLARFGNTWCDQYPNHEAAGVDQYGLKRVMPLAWPKRFQADGVTPLAEQVEGGDPR